MLAPIAGREPHQDEVARKRRPLPSPISDPERAKVGIPDHSRLTESLRRISEGCSKKSSENGRILLLSETP